MSTKLENTSERESLRGRCYATNARDVWRGPSGFAAGTRALLRSAAISVSSFVPRHVESRVVRCIYLHTVMEDERRGFEQLVKLIGSQGDVIGTREVLDIISGRVPLDGRYFHISFDDGFAGVVRNAVPILIDHRMTATIFVATAFVEADFDAVANYCMCTMDYAAPIEIAGWKELREAHAAAFEIGSHTHHHVRLTGVSKDAHRLMSELQSSKSLIEQNLGGPCISIAWPYGTDFDVDKTALAAVQRAGYKACFSGIRGRVEPGITDPFRIPRHQVEAGWLYAHKKAWIAGLGERTSR
jgi:peptidoglycan/xylan/chitin deacetylase (PgdA/CDA1 family)